MQKKDLNYFINNPVFVKFKKRFDFHKWGKKEWLKSVFINERIVEIPYAIHCLSSIPRWGTVLDLGCMESPLAMQVASLGYLVTGLDLREYPYKHPNLTFVKGNILKLPFEDQTYDMVYSISTIEHVGMGAYQDPMNGANSDVKAVDEVFRVLKKDGVFCLTLPYGVACSNHRQRIYGQAELKDLLNKFQIQEQRFFTNAKNGHYRNNFWKKISQEDADQIASAETTNCVALIKATK